MNITVYSNGNINAGLKFRTKKCEMYKLDLRAPNFSGDYFKHVDEDVKNIKRGLEQIGPKPELIENKLERLVDKIDSAVKEHMKKSTVFDLKRYRKKSGFEKIYRQILSGKIANKIYYNLQVKNMKRLTYLLRKDVWNSPKTQDMINEEIFDIVTSLERIGKEKLMEEKQKKVPKISDHPKFKTKKIAKSKVIKISDHPGFKPK